MNLLAPLSRVDRTLAVLSCIATLSACASISTGSHYDETTNFGAYRTFAWLSDTPYIRDGSDALISPLTQSKIQTAIQSQLTRKGYAYVENDDGADFVVAYTVGTRDKIRFDSYPIEYHGTWGWHVHGSHYYIREYRPHSYTKGTLGVDIFDGRSKKPVWHGWAEKTITGSDRKDPTSTIEEGVATLFESFPR